MVGTVPSRNWGAEEDSLGWRDPTRRGLRPHLEQVRLRRRQHTRRLQEVMEVHGAKVRPRTELQEEARHLLLCCRRGPCRFFLYLPRRAPTFWKQDNRTCFLSVLMQNVISRWVISRRVTNIS